jgi:hypothetical protein
MDTATIDQEFEKLQGEFDDVAKTVQALAQKLQAAEQAGDKNATEWLGDLNQVAQDIDDEQTQAKVVLLALHSFIAGVAQGQEQRAPQPGMTIGGFARINGDGRGDGSRLEPDQQHFPLRTEERGLAATNPRQSGPTRSGRPRCQASTSLRAHVAESALDDGRAFPRPPGHRYRWSPKVLA